MKRLIALNWYGGKFTHLPWLLPLLPKSHHYCEPFGGSAAVLLNREPSPVETYNDEYGEVVNFFRMLRSRGPELVKLLELTPFSREEFLVSLESNEGIDDLERARRFFVRSRQVMNGLAEYATAGRWAHCIDTTRSSMSGLVSRWLGSINGLQEVAERLRRVQIDNDDAFTVLGRYDSPKTLFYCDPPYPLDVRSRKKGYEHEWDDEEYVRLAEVLHRVQGRVALSGYRYKLLDDLFADWERLDGPTRCNFAGHSQRQEVLWMNYSPMMGGIRA